MPAVITVILRMFMHVSDRGYVSWRCDGVNAGAPAEVLPPDAVDEGVLAAINFLVVMFLSS